MRLAMLTVTMVGSLLLAGCSGGGDDADDNGRVNLSITDAPVDDVDSVVIQFSGVAFKRAGAAAEVVQNLTPSICCNTRKVGPLCCWIRSRCPRATTSGYG
jgi:hypothetical protein